MPLTVPFRLPRGFRRITQNDVTMAFRSDEPRMNEMSLSDYYEYSLQTNQYVVLHVDAVRILGLMAFIICDDHVYLEYLARNDAVRTEGPVGQKLVSLLEGIARQLTKSEIRLDS